MPEIIKPGRYFDFMKMRAFWLVVSLGLTFGSLLLIVFKGPNYGTDFKGGTEVELAFRKPVSAGDLRAAAHESGFAHPDVVEVSDPNTPHKFIVRVQEVSALDAAKKAQLPAAVCYPAPGAAGLPAAPRRSVVRVQEAGALDDAKKAQLQAAVCYQAPGAAELPADRCPAEARP